MLDTHLISMALAIIGTGAAAALVVAVSIVAIAAIRQHDVGSRRIRLAARRSAAPVREPELREPALR